ncbi:arsenite efflux transporter metallochaperone ArsD [Pseudohalocynthiibacter sp. F2068]|jgi:glutaredoxin|uniref:arsenite efflux transporter metallochaperone ArsD n=1 Tax=Pseudohalocynthiibacter sp. F2068 TaxID=2926418 RepID=UPI001FF69D9F|nr:arsenite efflux transporter metallochaperone ArsD [Pseudohalocynthiibacter sp. F2068]MCK0103833.1 arsenite efflux transporter metallochaperone ArsD [Pseudohalocynthiibacter sp. F2068]
MTNVTVYDPAMCCSTGICGAEVEQQLVTFAADLDWLKSKGIAVTRINLSQEPAKFAENNKVKAVLESSGVEGLPVIMLGDTLNSSGRYPARGELAEMAGVAYTSETGTSGQDGSISGYCGSKKSAEETSSGCC